MRSVLVRNTLSPLLSQVSSLALLRTLALPEGLREGWGLTADPGGAFYASDGSSTLQVLDSYLDGPELRVSRAIQVTAGGRPLGDLNDLQWVRGEIWANVYGHGERSREVACSSYSLY